MQHEFHATASGGPLAGVVMASVGLVGYAGATALKAASVVGDLARSAAPSAIEFAQAAIPAQPATAADWGQYLMAALSIAGGVIAWVSAQRSKVHGDRLAMDKAEADADRERKRLDADADRDRWLKDRMAELSIQQAELKAHLGRQDDAIAAVKQAVALPSGVISPSTVAPGSVGEVLVRRMVEVGVDDKKPTP